ncbi:MAG: hypothetical protein JRF53_10340 [Deltaproteobacteria bacterium]|nr:hypothetical protein [Deltaproteobacteria bacterium]
MKTQKNGKISDLRKQKAPIIRTSDILKEVYPLSGEMALDRILREDNPRELIRGLPHEDFFWLVKKVGDNDCLTLLELASQDQWQYLLDLEMWRKDRLNPDQAFQWLERLKQADPDGLARWLFGEGQAFANFYFFKSIQLVIKEEEEEVFQPDEDFVAFDGVFYFRVLDKRHRETIENILRAMAEYDLERYQAMLLGLAGVLPAEIEEDMYRMRNIRMAEHGFLPFDEAFSIYAPLDAGTISTGDPGEKAHILTDDKERSLVPLSPLYHAGGPNLLTEAFSRVILTDDKERSLVPLSPLYHAGGPNLLTEAFSRVTDSVLLDRMRLEFAGLCNQILSADGIWADDLEVLIKTCRKAAGYLNLTLEKLCGEDLDSAGRLLRDQSLVSVFRVGFGLALKLKWEAETWLKKSWFYARNLEFGFWGEDWGGTLTGLLEDKPRFYMGLKEGEEYKDFEELTELDACARLINRLRVLDRLLARLTGLCPLDEAVIQESRLTFHKLLFNFWARQVLKLEPCFSGISLAQAKEFFGHIRAGKEVPPYPIPEFRQKFVRDFMALDPFLEAEDAEALKETLSLVWEEFGEEYQWVSSNDLDGRFTKFIRIMS